MKEITIDVTGTVVAKIISSFGADLKRQFDLDQKLEEDF